MFRAFLPLLVVSLGGFAIGCLLLVLLGMSCFGGSS